MEGRGGDLEAKADDHHGEREEGQQRRPAIAQPSGNGGDGGRSGGAERQRDAVEEECGREGAEQEVLNG